MAYHGIMRCPGHSSTAKKLLRMVIMIAALVDSVCSEDLFGHAGAYKVATLEPRC